MIRPFGWVRFLKMMLCQGLLRCQVPVNCTILSVLFLYGVRGVVLMLLKFSWYMYYEAPCVNDEMLPIFSARFRLQMQNCSAKLPRNFHQIRYRLLKTKGRYTRDSGAGNPEQEHSPDGGDPDQYPAACAAAPALVPPDADADQCRRPRRCKRRSGARRQRRRIRHSCAASCCPRERGASTLT